MTRTQLIQRGDEVLSGSLVHGVAAQAVSDHAWAVGTLLKKCTSLRRVHFLAMRRTACGQGTKPLGR
jgi:hypothetical protein